MGAVATMGAKRNCCSAVVFLLGETVLGEPSWRGRSPCLLTFIARHNLLVQGKITKKNRLAEAKSQELGSEW